MAKSKKIDAAKKEPAKLLHRVIHARLPENLRPACEAIARHARDVNNTAVWIASRAFECFAWDKVAKRSKLKAAADLPQDGLLVLSAYNKAIASQNAKRIAKAKAALAAFEIQKAKAEGEGKSTRTPKRPSTPFENAARTFAALRKLALGTRSGSTSEARGGSFAPSPSILLKNNRNYSGRGAA
jgi:hypothetical protein